MSKPSAVIVDIDGTIALKGVRHQFDWTRVHEDRPHREVIKVVTALSVANAVIFVSGRSDACQESTRRWIDYNVPFPHTYGYKLFMRRDSDFRRDSVVKEEIYRTYVEPSYSVLCVLDDRNQTVAMWRSIGLVCLQVAPGDF